MRDSTAAPKRQVPNAQLEQVIDKENQLRVIRNRVADEHQPRKKNYARGRVGVLTNILKHRHGGPCDTDDAGVWFGIALPFLVEASTIASRDPHKDALGWAKRHVPIYVADAGMPEIIRQIDAAIAERGKVAQTSTGAWVDWLPGMDAIVSAIRLTWEEVTALKLRGYGQINPPDASTRREHNRKRMRATRLARGVTPQSSRTKTKDDATDAECIGRDARTLRRWQKDGRMPEMLQRGINDGSIDVQKPCVSYLLGKYEMHRFRTQELAGNDNGQVSLTA
ncbi:hypothetical protein GPNCGGLF_LOCUS4311 [Methylorubrum aminovorans]